MKECPILQQFFSCIPEQFEIRKDIKYNYDLKEKKLIRSSIYVSNLRLSLSQIDIIDKIQEMRKLNDKFNNKGKKLIEAISPLIEVEQQILQLPNLKTENENSVMLNIDKGKVMIVLIDVKNQQYQKIVDKLNQMSNFNQDYKFFLIFMGPDLNFQMLNIKNNNKKLKLCILDSNQNKTLADILNIYNQDTYYILLSDNKICAVSKINNDDFIDQDSFPIESIHKSLQKTIQQNTNLPLSDYKQYIQKVTKNLIEMLEGIFLEEEILQFSFCYSMKLDKIGQYSSYAINYLIIKVLLSKKEGLQKEQAFKKVLKEFGIENDYCVFIALQASKLQKKIFKENLEQVLNSEQIQYKFVEQEIYEHILKDNKFVLHTSKLYSKCTFPELAENMVQKLLHVIDEIQEQNTQKINELQVLREEILKHPRSNKKFKQIKGYYNNEDEQENIKNCSGQVLLIIVIIPCEFTMYKLNEFSQKMKQIYGEGLRFAYLASSYEKEENENIQDIYFDSPFYHLKDSKQTNEIVTSVNNISDDQYLPYYILVDQNGITDSTGLFTPSMNQVIAELYLKQESFCQKFSDIMYINLIQFLQTPSNNKLNSLLKIQIIIENNKLFSLKIESAYYENQIEEYQQFKKQLFQIIPEIFWGQEENLIQNFTLNIEPKTCENCSQELKGNLNYTINSKLFLCEQCGQFFNGFQNVFNDTLLYIPKSKVNSKNQNFNFFKIYGEKIYNKEKNLKCYNCLNSIGNNWRYIPMNREQNQSNESNLISYCKQCFLTFWDLQYQNQFIQAQQKYGINKDTIFLELFSDDQYLI